MRRISRFQTLRFGLIVVAVAISVVAAASAQAPTSNYQLVEGWPQLPPGEEFGTISGVDGDAKGNVYAFRRNDSAVLVFDASGKFLNKWSAGTTLAHTIRIDREGFLWVTDRDGDEVKKFRTDGTLLMTIGAPGKPFNGPDMFHGPADVLVTANGDIYIADGYWNSRIVKFNKDGKYIKSLGNGPGRGAGQFGIPHTMVQDSQGRLIVSDRCDLPRGPNDERRVNPGCTDIRLQFLDLDGKVLTQHLDYHPNGLAMSIVGDLIYASTTGREGRKGEIVILNSRTGEIVDAFPSAAATHALAVDKSGDNIYVGDMGKFEPGKRVGSGGSVRRFTRKPGT